MRRSADLHQRRNKIFLQFDLAVRIALEPCDAQCGVIVKAFTAEKDGEVVGRDFQLFFLDAGNLIDKGTVLKPVTAMRGRSFQPDRPRLPCLLSSTEAQETPRNSAVHEKNGLQTNGMEEDHPP